MKSIAHSKGRSKCIVLKRERVYRMVKGDLGTQVKREPLRLWAHKKHDIPKRKRGDIKGFSENSRSRLRVLLSTAKWSNGDNVSRVGFTLTLPWAASPTEWRKVWAAFIRRLIKKYPQIGMIWRIEMTTGKAVTSGGLRRAHVHAILWIPTDKALNGSSIPDSSVVRWLNMKLVASAWIDSWSYYAPSLTDRQMRYATSFGEHKGNGIVTKILDNSTDGAIHYLCDHASKHKDEQLGWCGRQWGVVNRSNFVFECDGEVITGSQWVQVSRTLRKLNRNRRKRGQYAALPYGDNKCFFGGSESVLNDVVKAVKQGRIC